LDWACSADRGSAAALCLLRRTDAMANASIPRTRRLPSHKRIWLCLSTASATIACSFAPHVDTHLSNRAVSPNANCGSAHSQAGLLSVLDTKQQPANR
jgi:hypothetical protein